MRTCDNYAIQCYRNCPKHYYWRIVRGLVKPREEKVAADFGTAIHKALEVYYGEGCTTEAEEHAYAGFIMEFAEKEILADSKRTVLKGTEILSKYFERYRGEPFNVVATEIGGAFELSEEWVYTTRLDLVVEWQEPKGVYVFDHKTSSDIGRLVAKPNNQLTGYIANLVEIYGEVLGAVLNVIGVYETDEVIDKAAPKVMSEKTGKPVYAKKKREIFSRLITTRTPMEIAEWRKETLWILGMIEKSEREGLWPHYTDFCSAYSSRCWYLDLCNSVNEGTVERMIEAGIYVVEPWKPYERVGEDKEAKEGGVL